MDIQEEIARVRELLPLKPPADCFDVMIDRGGLSQELLIYSTDWVKEGEAKKRKVKLRCTACGCTSYAEKTLIHSGCWRSGRSEEYGFVHPITSEIHHSHESTVCPNCRCGVDVRHVSYIGHEHCIQCVDVMEVQNVGGYIALIEWRLFKECNKDGVVTYSSRPVEAAVMIGKRFVRYTASGRYFSGYYYLSEWEARKRFDDMFGEVSRAFILPFDNETVWSSNVAISALEEYLSMSKTGMRHPVLYLKLWSKYPSIENLIRSGAQPLVDDCIQNARGFSYYSHRQTFNASAMKIFDFKKSRPHEILGVQKEEFTKVRHMNRDDFVLYKIARASQVEDVDAVLKMARKRGLKDVAEFFSEYPSAPIVKTLHYLDRQEKRCRTAYLISLSYLRDYWNLVKKAQGDIAAEQRYPKDLETEHDRFMARVEEKGDVRLSGKIQERAKKMERWAFSDDELGLMIRPAASHEELITEGKVLNHCVAGYAEDHAEGKTTIFFIRKTEHPDVPFYTLEFQKGKVAQNRGKRNCERTEAVREFENRWLRYLREELKYVG